MNDNIQKELRENEYNPNIVSKDSLLKKLVKAGLITAITGTSLKKISKAKNIDYLQNDIVQAGLSTSIMIGTSNDDDYTSDIGAIGAIYALKGFRGIIKHKVNYSTINDFASVYSKLEKMDELYKNISLFSINLSSNARDFMFSTLGDAGKAAMASDKKYLVGKLFDGGKSIASSIYNTFIYNPLKNISEKGATEGLKSIFNNIINHSDYEVYKEYFRDVDINSLNMMAKGINFNSLNIKEIDYTSITKDQYKKFIKYRNIEKNTIFTDIIGRYTEYDKKTSTINANISRILEDDAHFGNPLNILTDNFVRDYSSQELEVTEENFVKYLIDNGFSNIVDKYYKNDKYYSYGEISNLFNGKIEDLNESIREHMFLGKKASIVNSDYNNNLLHGFKNSDILKNFAFTNVVEKNRNRIIDNTALDGFNSTMNILSIFEKNIVGHYSGHIGRMINMWSPFSLIQSNARIKNNIHNNLLGFTESNGVIINDGFAYGYDVLETNIKNNAETRKTSMFKFYGNSNNINSKKIKIRDLRTNKKNNNELFSTVYYKSDSASFKVDFKKTTSDILNEDYHVRKADLKHTKTVKQIYDTFQNKGFKTALESLTKSTFNPFGIRYEKDKGFRRVLNKDGYYKEGTIFNNAYEFIFRKNKEIDYEEIVKDNQRFESIFDYLGKEFLKNNFEAKDLNEFYKSGIFENIVKDFRVFDKEIGKENVDLYINAIGTFLREGQNQNFVDALKKIEIFNTNNEKIAENATKLLEPTLQKINNILIQMSKDPNYSFDNIFKGLKTGEIKPSDVFNFLQKNNKEINEEYAKKLFNIIEQIGQNKNNAKNIIFDSFKNKYKIKNNNLEKYLDNIDINDKDNIFYNVYNEILGFENSKLFEDNDNITVFLKELKKIKKDKRNIIDQLDDFVGEFNKDKHKKLLEDYRNLYKDINEKLIKPNISEKRRGILNRNKEKVEKAFQEEIMRKLMFDKKNSLIKELEETNTFNRNASFFDQLLNKEDLNFNTYEEINKIRNKTFDDYIERKTSKGNEDMIRRDLQAKNINQFKNLYMNLYYKMENNNQYVNNLIYSSFEKALETKGILNAVKSLIDSTIVRFSGGEYFKSENIATEQYIKRKIVSSSKDSVLKSQSTLNLSTRNIFSKFQDAAEVIGIERLTNKQLGNTTGEMFKNFFKYRYLPLMALTTGAIALNSFSDMIVPDEVPIIGNGIVGVGTRAYATARVGLQYGLKYTGMLSVLRTIENMAPGVIENGFTHFFDPLMDPSEMIDVYFYGKPIEVKKNRNWFTAGRQSAEGEEFGQYRPHLLYIWGNPSSGIYSNKAEKFFRRDFLLTKYPWYILDPYKEEREAYENFGLVHPKTEQLFKDIPIFGHLLSSTVGEVIKPTQYIGEQYWRVSDNLMINPNYDSRNPYSPKYIEFTNPNRFVESIFEGIEDLKTFSGLPGYMITKATEFIFGSTNPYNNDVTLSSLDNDTSYYRAYEKLQLGGLFGTTEAIRRLIDNGNSLGTIEMNPLKQKTADWMPEYFQNGNNIYSNLDYAEYIIPGRSFEKAKENRDISKELQEFRTLSMIAPLSDNFKIMKSNFLNELNSMSNKEREYFYESLSYADFYGKRDYNEKFNIFNPSKEIDVTIKKKLSLNEFIGDDGRRYKISGITSDFNKLSKTYGSERARKLMDELNSTFNVGDSYTFEISENHESAVGTDSDGEYLRVDSNLISNKLTVEKNVYRSPNANLLGLIIGTAVKSAVSVYAGSAGTMEVEKVFGTRSAYQEWSYESVQSPYFRDWDSPISSFVEPYYTMSSNSIATATHFLMQTNKAFLNSNSSQLNILGNLSMLGMIASPLNSILGRVSTSSDYKDDTKIQDEIEKIKFISGEKSFYNMTGSENLRQFSDMLNEQDAVYFEELVNTTNANIREKILATSNERMSTILETIWARQEAYYNNKEFVMPERNMPNSIEITNIGAYTGNVDATRNLLKSSYGISLSKLDSKRQGVIKAYRGGISQKEGEFISSKMYGLYNEKPYISSTISSVGNINISRRNSEY